MKALNRFFEPATLKVTVSSQPRTRATVCAKCPFGGSELVESERVQANAIKARVAASPKVIWGCHETVTTKGKPMICAGFAAWKQDLRSNGG